MPGTASPRVPSDSPITEVCETIDWFGAWERGTLGSLGRFQLRERLGDGGFGQVFLAFDPRLDRDVAIKVLKQPNPSDRVMERFFREARAVARLDHPNIVAVYDAGFDDGRCWVAYQLVSGRPLWWYRDRQRMDATTAARIIRDLADALDHAHRMGVVHRDIKPANVIIDDQRPAATDRLRPGPPVRPGVRPDPRRRRGGDAGLHEPGAGHRPEPAGRRAERRLQPGRHLLRDALPSAAARGQDGIGRASSGRGSAASYPSPSRASARSIDPSIPAGLDRICCKAMSPRPSDRYATARAFADDLDRMARRSHGLHPASIPLGGPAFLHVPGRGMLALVGRLVARRSPGC